MNFEEGVVVLALITLLAAVVNGALGYGFSSITIPVALMFHTNKVLNPVMVLIEIMVNTYTLIINRKSLPNIWRRSLPILLGVLPGALAGSYVLFAVKPEWLRLFTYVLLLPLIMLQAGGIRRPILSEKAVGLPFGAGLGLLYSVTTISGPPLAVLLNNQGYVKQDFRAALGLIRLVESTTTAIIYYFLGLYSMKTASLCGAIFPSVVIGMPIGAYIIGKMNPETFRRICMSFDAWIVGFGLSKVLISLDLAARPAAYGVLLAVVLIDAWLLRLFFRKRARLACS